VTSPVHFSSDRSTWETPDHVLDRVRAIAPIALDPCTEPDNPTGAVRWITAEDEPDGLQAPWHGMAAGGLCYVNPPYTRGRGPRDWADKIALEAALECEIVTLVPARTDTRAFRALVKGAAVTCFWRGRITFRGAPGPAPFPSAFVYHGWRPERFVEVFADAGLIWRVR
jgi:hypothetical protein